MADGDTKIILSVFAMYVFMFVMFGLIGMNIETSIEQSDIDDLEDPSIISFLTQIGMFFWGIGFTIASLPWWANTMLFTPLTITIIYIILKYIRGI